MLKVNGWAARAPNILTVDDWQRWASAPTLPTGPEALKRNLVPPTISRRASRVSQYALESALELIGDDIPDYGVFASRHGEIGHTVELLQSIANNEPLSPTAFSQSVHNTAAGLFTIIKKSHMKTTSICAGTFTFDMALLEASTYLKVNPSHKVLLVCFDQSLPDYYQKELTEHSVDYSLALLLTTDDGLEGSPKPNNPELGSWPRALAFLQNFLSSKNPRLSFSVNENRWNICEIEN